MKRTAEWTDWFINLVTGCAIFVGLTCAWFPDAFGIVDARAEIAAVLKLDETGGLPPMSEKQLWSDQALVNFDNKTGVK